MELTDEELDLLRQWFNVAQDVTRGYLGLRDYALARKIYEKLGQRVPHRVLRVLDQKERP
jgi:hypothetical protein